MNKNKKAVITVKSGKSIVISAPEDIIKEKISDIWTNYNLGTKLYPVTIDIEKTRNDEVYEKISILISEIVAIQIEDNSTDKYIGR